MSAKSAWRESSSGPDVLDCAVMMAAIGALHSAHVAVIVSPSGTSSPTSVDVAMSALFDRLPGSSLPPSVGVHSEWPNKAGQSFWGLVYELCWKLDEGIGQVYRQESLWE